MNIRKDKKQLIIAIIVGLIIATISFKSISKLEEENDNLKKMISGETTTTTQNRAKSSNYVVSVVDIKSGDKILRENLRIKSFPVEIDGGAVDIAQVEGMNARRDIRKDMPILEEDYKITQEDIISTEPRTGYRAIPVNMSTSQIPSFASVGSYVDLYFPKKSLNAQNIKILAINDNADSSLKTIMFEIKEIDVGAFIIALQDGAPALVQRNKFEETGYYFYIPAGSPLDEIISTEGLDGAPSLNEISDIESEEGDYTGASAPRKTYSSSKSARSIPIVKASELSGNNEIEIISGDKKMYVGVPR